MVSMDEFRDACRKPESQTVELLQSINLPVRGVRTREETDRQGEESETAKHDRERINRRLFEVLDFDGEGELPVVAMKERAFRLKEDGSGLSTDLTLLLVEVLQNQRMLERIE